MNMAINDMALDNVTGGMVFKLKDGRPITVELIEEYANYMRMAGLNEGSAFEFAREVGFPNVGTKTFTSTSRFVDYWVTKQKELLNRGVDGLDAYRGTC